MVTSTTCALPTRREVTSNRASGTPCFSNPTTVSIDGEDTQVLIEQTSAVAYERLGDFVGRLSHDELEAIEAALRLVLELD